MAAARRLPRAGVGRPGRALDLFDENSARDVLSWTPPVATTTASRCCSRDSTAGGVGLHRREPARGVPPSTGGRRQGLFTPPPYAAAPRLPRVWQRPAAARVGAQTATSERSGSRTQGSPPSASSAPRLPAARHLCAVRCGAMGLRAVPPGNLSSADPFFSVSAFYPCRDLPRVLLEEADGTVPRFGVEPPGGHHDPLLPLGQPL